jgi:hypothetical protein
MLLFRLTAVSILILIILTNKAESESARNNVTQIDPSIAWFLNYTPFLEFGKIPKVSKKCLHDFQMFSAAMDNLKLWALKSKIWFGVLQ